MRSSTELAVFLEVGIPSLALEICGDLEEHPGEGRAWRGVGPQWAVMP